MHEAGELCVHFARLSLGLVNMGLPTSLRFVQIAFGDFHNPPDVNPPIDSA
jgi:hypothetical protein